MPLEGVPGLRAAGLCEPPGQRQYRQVRLSSMRKQTLSRWSHPQWRWGGGMRSQGLETIQETIREAVRGFLPRQGLESGPLRSLLL